ncbi:MAG TPA: hypothetical protein VGF13_08770, partial [Verrucomicrobiae bacterium]
FSEPGQTAPAEEWNTFNKWILGDPIPQPAINEKPFIKMIRDLAMHVRRYNASLYRLRRLHYYVYSGNDPLQPGMPPRNPFGDLPDPIPQLGSPEFQIRIEKAEYDWEKVTKDIDAFIERKSSTAYGGLEVVAADMSEVNGYIVSMRLIAEVPSKKSKSGGIEPEEVGGSSSHVAITSAFSSYSSP